MARHQLCTFDLAGRGFGIGIEHVQEIVRAQPLARAPLAPPAVRGLINLRGMIVPAIDLRVCLELPPLGADATPPTNIVIRTDQGPVSFLVDEIGDVIEVDDEAFELPPDNLRGAVRELIAGVYKLERSLLMVLMPEATLAKCK